MNASSNAGTALERILAARRAEVEHRKRVLPETALKYGAMAAEAVRDFASALSRDGLNVIAELKPASPSRGVIREPFDAPALAKALGDAGAAALSVLTEGEFFGGSLKNLRDSRKQVALPALRKDFIFDPWQVWEARANDADSFLLIVAALEDGQLRDLIALGREVNNRDLKTLTVRMETSFELVELIPEECVAVAESGLRTHADLAELRRAGFDAFLIGEHLMAAPDPAAALFHLLTPAK